MKKMIAAVALTLAFAVSATAADSVVFPAKTATLPSTTKATLPSSSAKLATAKALRPRSHSARTRLMLSAKGATPTRKPARPSAASATRSKRLTLMSGG